MQRKQKKCAKKFDNVRFCVRTLCELQPLAAFEARYTSPPPPLWYRHDDLSAPLCRFFQGGNNSIEREETIISRGMLRVSVMPMGRLSVLSTPVAGSMTSHTRRVVFLVDLSLQPFTELHNKRSNSWNKKISFKSTNRICVIRGI